MYLSPKRLPVALGGMSKNVYHRIFQNFQKKGFTVYDSIFIFIFYFFLLFFMHNQVFTAFSTGWDKNY